MWPNFVKWEPEMKNLGFDQIGTWKVKMTDADQERSFCTVFEFEMVLAPRCTMTLTTSTSFTYAWPSSSETKWAEVSSKDGL